MNGPSGAVEVVGGEQVEQSPSEHSKCQAALGHTDGAPSTVRGLGCGEDTEPVFDGLAGETGPGPVGFAERAGVGLRPQDQQRSVFPGGQPSPCCAHDVGQVTRALSPRTRPNRASSSVRARASRARKSPSLEPNRNNSTRGLEPIAPARGRSDRSARPCWSAYWYASSKSSLWRGEGVRAGSLTALVCH